MDTGTTFAPLQPAPSAQTHHHFPQIMISARLAGDYRQDPSFKELTLTYPHSRQLVVDFIAEDRYGATWGYGGYLVHIPFLITKMLMRILMVNLYLIHLQKLTETIYGAYALARP